MITRIRNRAAVLPLSFFKIILRAKAGASFLLLMAAMNLRADQFDTMRLYWQNFLIASATNLSAQAGTNYSIDQSGHYYFNIAPATIAITASNYWSTMNTNSSNHLWSDLTIQTVSANLNSTFDRLQMMALAWATPGSSLRGNADLASAVSFGLDWMNTNTYAYTTNGTRYDNWWNWAIGGPQSLLHTVILIYPALTGTQITNYCNAVDNFSPIGADPPPGTGTGIWSDGANTADMALVMTLRGIVGRDGSRISTAQTNLVPVFNYVTGGDGFYTDGSFVYHNKIAYNGHYGMILLGDAAELVSLLQGSTWQITNPAVTNICDWVFNSYEPLLYNGAVMDMVRGRCVSFSSESEWIDGAAVLTTIKHIAQFAPLDEAAAMSNFVNSPLLPPAQFHFPNMDRVLGLRSGFAFGISMSSTRIDNYESINTDNLHGWFTGDGMTYLYVGSGESQFTPDFWFTVDPYHMPGTTEETNVLANAAGEGRTTDQNWVGGAQVAGTYGIAGMSLHPVAATTTLFAKKSWFMFDNEIVCLGAGITCGDASGVHTTVENRRLGIPITNSLTLNGTAITPTVGWSSNLSSATPSWCALSGTGGYYFPAGNSNLQATLIMGSGSRSQIDQSVDNGNDPTLYTNDFLKLWINHGSKPTNSTYAYVLLPGMDAGSVSNYALNPDIVILTNTARIQAVKKPALGVVAANFWTNGTSSADLITISDKASVITWETPSNILVGISDPTQTNTSSINVTLGCSAASVLSQDPGVTVLQLSPQIILSVNVNGAHGKAFQASFQLGMPTVAIVMPATNTVYLDGTNQTLLLSATASNTLPGSVMTTIWSQTGGSGFVMFGNSNMLTTTANFSADGVYNITFTASNGATNSASLTVVVNSSIGTVANGLLGWWKMDETNGSIAFDSSGNGADAIVHGGTFTTGYLSNALYLTGGTNNASFTSVDANQTTVAAWVRADGNGGSLYPRILASPGCYFNFRFDGGTYNNALEFATTAPANGSVDGDWVAPASSISTNVWYYVAVSYDKSSITNVPTLYVNGIKMSVISIDLPSVTPASYVGTTYIGNRQDLTRGWDGLVDDLRIYDRLLTDAEVQTLASAAVMPNLAPAVNAGNDQTIIWPFTATLNGTATDDDNPNPPSALTTTWSEISGPGTVTFANSNSLATTASFSAPGSYQLQLAANDGQITTVSSITVMAVTRPNISFQLLSDTLQLSWPSNIGNWQLQFQTNAIGAGLSSNWLDVSGSITNSFTLPINPAAGSMFYRLLLITN